VRLLPREEEFFVLFTEVANRNKEAVEHLRQLFQAAPDRRTPHVEAISGWSTRPIRSHMRSSTVSTAPSSRRSIAKTFTSSPPTSTT